MVTVHQERKEKSDPMEGAGEIQTATCLRKAQQVARNILNLSQSELEDFISPADASQSIVSVCVFHASIIIIQGHLERSVIISLEIFKMNIKGLFLGSSGINRTFVILLKGEKYGLNFGTN